MRIILFGIVLHLIFLLSVFDIYFKSPIINNIPVHNNSVIPPAKRLVLFVGDGIRADSMYTVDSDEQVCPYLRSITAARGVWGVAHSRVPTESRPGHIALIAGFYEDPSAVFSGWKDNLVEFDSLFNRSTVTYSWGSPDILPMFKKGAEPNKVHAFCYNPEAEDFSGHGSTTLNTWVFDKVEEFIKSAENDDALKQSLNKQGVVFFLHLLGPDVAGHTNKPHSRQYKDNIRVVDEGIKSMEKLLNDFYLHDNKTAFVFTADHGMTDWGSHGAGSASETEVPLIVWGAGANTPQVLDAPDPDTPVRWNLRHLRRLDVAQADIAPLMAVLVGTSIPVHSVGVLPLDYLSFGDKDKAASMFINAEQLSAQFGRKREMVESNMVHWLYSPFKELTKENEELMKQNITRLVAEGNYNESIMKSKILIELSKAGLEYYHSYFQSTLLFCVSLSFAGWIAWLFCQLLKQQSSGTSYKYANDNGFQLRNLHVWPDTVFLLLATVTIYFIYVQSLPLQFYLYCCLPLQLWWAVLRQWKTTHSFTKLQPLLFLGTATLYLILIELLVMTFFKRWVLSLVVAAVAFWPFFLRERRKMVPTNVQISWIGCLLTLAAFPALPVVGQQTQVGYVILCGGLWLLFGLISFYLLSFSKTGWMLPIQLLLLAIATTVILSTTRDFENGFGLQLWNQVMAWLLLIISLAVPLMTKNEIPARFLSIGLALAVPFLLLCVGHEAFFLLILFLSLCIWLAIESYLTGVEITRMKFEETSEQNQSLSSDDFRKCFFFLMYVILSFFGTGNVASVNSWDISWVRCFLTVFSPFTMMGLVLLKTIVPFLLVTCSFRAVNTFSQVKAENMFIIVLIYCDIMGLHFLFAVTNKGSWLEIGMSVSHFVIMEVTVLFLASLYYIARLYTGTVFTKEPSSAHPIAPIWTSIHKRHPD